MIGITGDIMIMIDFGDIVGVLGMVFMVHIHITHIIMDTTIILDISDITTIHHISELLFTEITDTITIDMQEIILTENETPIQHQEETLLTTM